MTAALTRALAIAAAIAAAFAAAFATTLRAQVADTSLLRRNSSSMSGLPGLVFVPSATATPAGTVDFTYDGVRAPAVIPHLAQQRNGFIVIGFLPWLTVSARGTVAVDTTRKPVEVRDLSANFQVRLLPEGRVAPALAVGVQDLGQGATPYFPTRYFVATKTFTGGALSLGYGTGPAMLDGPFGGASVGLGQWATAMGEYDGHKINGGLRVFPFPAYADRFRIQPRLDIVWRQDNGAAIGAGIRTLIGGTREALSLPARSEARIRPTDSATDRRASKPDTPPGPAPGAGRTPANALRAAEQQLVAIGLENVRVTIEHAGGGATIAVEYENRRFNRDEMDALGIAMGVAAIHAADSVRRMRVTIRRVDVPVMTVESDVRAFAAFVNDRGSAESFADQLVITTPGGGTPTESATGPRQNASRLKVDLFVRPRFETQVLTDFGVAATRVTALADAYVQLGPGLVLNGRRGIPVVQTSAFWDGIEDPNADRLLLHQALPVPLRGQSPSMSVLTQFSAGRFGHNAVGFANELDVSVADGLLSFGSTVAVFGQSLGDLDHTLALGTMRARYPAWDLTASLTAGRFRNGDSGGAIELARQFGNTELGFYIRSTEFASVAGVALSLPLTPARELPPIRLRPRPPDLYVQELQSSVFEPLPILRRDVGRLLGTDHEIRRVYRTRDRLQPVTVRVHVDALRDAVRRWLGGTVLHD